MRIIKVGTRQSALALTQTEQVVEQLRKLALAAGIDCDFELVKMITKGDRILDVSLSKIGGKGLFVKEIEQALMDGTIDIAVHSMKDVPSSLQEGLVIGAIPQRVDPRDCLITREYAGLDQVPQGARVGTSSLRRAAQLLAHRPDLIVEPVRGNIDSRLHKLHTESFDAILLAAAGLIRMGWTDRISAYLSTEICIPAVGQGALGIECRGEDTTIIQLLAKLNHEPTAFTVRAERAFLNRLNGGCQIPIGAYAELIDETEDDLHALSTIERSNTVSDHQTVGKEHKYTLRLTGMVGRPDGNQLLVERRVGTDPEAVGRGLAEALVARGADRILAEYIDTTK